MSVPTEVLHHVPRIPVHLLVEDEVVYLDTSLCVVCRVIHVVTAGNRRA